MIKWTFYCIVFLHLQQFRTTCFVIFAKNIEAETWTPPYVKIPFERHLFPAGSSLMAAACAKVVWAELKFVVTAATGGRVKCLSAV